MASENASEQSIQKFAGFFRSYGIALGVILAAIPFATSRINLLPMYDSHRDVLTFFTSLLSLLGVAVLFNIRRRIGSAVFPYKRRTLSGPQMKQRFRWGVLYPALLSILSAVALLAYLLCLNISVDSAALKYGHYSDSERLIEILSGRSVKNIVDSVAFAVPVHETGVKVPANLFGRSGDSAKVWGMTRDVTRDGEKRRVTSVEFLSEGGVDLVRKLTPSAEIPLRWAIEMSYVLMFLGAAMTFVWLGLIEYMQAEMDLTDRTLLEDPYRHAHVHRFTVAGIRDSSIVPYFEMEYCLEKGKAVLISGPDGPFCDRHKNPLRRSGAASDETEGTSVWECRSDADKEKKYYHLVNLAFSEIGITRRAKESAQNELVSLTKESNEE